MAEKLRLGDDQWRRLRGLHKGCPALRLPVLYSLNEEIVEAIVEEIPTFFKPADHQFEMDLIEADTIGFCYGHAIAGPAADADPSVLKDWDAKLNDLFAEQRRARSRGPRTAERRDRRRDRAESLRRAYRGWLILNTSFRRDIAYLRSQWETEIAKIGSFPFMPRWVLTDAEFDWPVRLRFEFMQFYLGWGLEGMLTWDLPVPMDYDEGVILRPARVSFDAKTLGNISTPSRTRVKSVSLELDQAGVSFFVPWYMVKSRRINLNEAFVDAGRRVPDRFSDWIQELGENPTHHGLTRYDRDFWLYRNRFLALESRYSEQCQKNVMALDRAFAYVADREPDTIKKARLAIRAAVERSARE